VRGVGVGAVEVLMAAVVAVLIVGGEKETCLSMLPLPGQPFKGKGAKRWEGHETGVS
jgi:hypothetical protein